MRIIKKLIFLAFSILFLGSFASLVSAQRPPVIPVPMGYGQYCSVTNSLGAWRVELSTLLKPDPCQTALTSLTPFSLQQGKIERAGLWSTNGENNVLRICNDGLQAYRGLGTKPIDDAKRGAGGKTNCIFVIAPRTLKIFSKPYSQNATAGAASPFDYDFYNQLNPTEFGQTVNSNCPDRRVIDKNGRQRCSLDNHGAYDWFLPTNTPLYAVAKGVVRMARTRDVCLDLGNGPQAEIYVEHQVGDGAYAERFITYYAHGSFTYVQNGQIVEKGQVLGLSGGSGCSSAPHLHFSTHRTTNLAGYYSFPMTFQNGGYGNNGPHGMIDPFGWNAPQGIDPWGWRFWGNRPDPYLGTLVNPGAFSIYLWEDGQAPLSND